MIRRSVALLSAAVFFASTGSVHAQQPLDKDADADRLFKEGQKLMEEHHFADACPKLESAYKKDQQLGTLLNLAYCHKEMGSTWIAWTEFREAESKAIDLKRNDRRDFARERMKELEKNLSRLIVDTNPKYDLYEVDLEDRHIFDAEKGIAFAAEPGQRKITFRAKGKKAAVQLVTVAPARESKDRIQHVQVPDMVDEEPVLTQPETPPTPPPVTPPPPATDQNHATWSTQKTLAIVSGVAGLGGVVVGSIFGLKTFGSTCADHTPPCLTHDRSDASTTGAISTTAFILGGAFLAGAVVLWITAPTGDAHAAVAGPTLRADLGPTWAGLHGTF